MCEFSTFFSLFFGGINENCQDIQAAIPTKRVVPKPLILQVLVYAYIVPNRKTHNTKCMKVQLTYSGLEQQLAHPQRSSLWLPTSPMSCHAIACTHTQKVRFTGIRFHSHLQQNISIQWGLKSWPAGCYSMNNTLLISPLPLLDYNCMNCNINFLGASSTVQLWIQLVKWSLENFIDLIDLHRSQ